mgnify:CR=1 FL=1
MCSFRVTNVTDFWFLAISSGKGGLDGWRMMATDDTGTDLWTVAGAWEELERGGVAV